MESSSTAEMLTSVEPQFDFRSVEARMNPRNGREDPAYSWLIAPS